MWIIDDVLIVKSAEIWNFAKRKGYVILYKNREESY